MAEIEKHALESVFSITSRPEITFVQPNEFTRLVVAIRSPGRGVVIEGPSGIGKTTAVKSAIEAAGLDDRVVEFSARKSQDVEYIRDLPSQIPIGTVIIDDFHRLDDDVKATLADLMKTLADDGAQHSKIIVLGIPDAGKALIAFGRDLANRIEIIPFEANPEHKIFELLEKGERALNVELNIRNEIVAGAHGSFYIAQMLAHETCLRAGVLSTRDVLTPTTESYEMVKAQVMVNLGRKFRETVMNFARGSKLRPQGRAPYLHLLFWLSQSQNWFINVLREADRHPPQRDSVQQVVSRDLLKKLVESSDEFQKVLHFDGTNNMLVAQDPQFMFYIRNLHWPTLAEEVGFISMHFPSRYDFALSFAGTDRSIAKAIFEGLQENELEVFYDHNEQYRILAENIEDYLAPIYASEAQLVVCVLGPDYPNRIWTKFESFQFRQRFKSGEVIPIVLDTFAAGLFDEVSKVGYISWSTGGDFATQVSKTVEMLLDKHASLRKAKAIEASKANKDESIVT